MELKGGVTATVVGIVQNPQFLTFYSKTEEAVSSVAWVKAEEPCNLTA